LKYPAKSSTGGRCGRTIIRKVLYSEGDGAATRDFY